MLCFRNISSLDGRLFRTAVENILMHTGIIESERGMNVSYGDGLPDGKSKGIFIQRDKNLEIGIIKSMEMHEGFFAPNCIAPTAGDKPLGVFFVKRGDSYVMRFDVISYMNSAVYNEMSFETEEQFKTFLEYQKRPFSEHLLLNLKNDIMLISERENAPFAEADGEETPLFLPTFDYDRIRLFRRDKDIAYGFMRLAGSRGFPQRYTELRKRLNADPWDRQAEVNGMLKEKHYCSMHFAFMSRSDRFTRRYSVKDAERIKDEAPEESFGIHLSYESGHDLCRAKKELERAERIGLEEKYTRYHYLFPINRKNALFLCENKVKADFSAGLRGRVGFQSGFCKPYFLGVGSTLEIPSCAMDSAVVQERKRKGFDLKKIADEVRSVGGIMSTIYHPSSLDENTFPEYRGILDEMMRCGEGMASSGIKNIMERYTAKPKIGFERHGIRVDRDSKKDIRLYIGGKKEVLKRNESVEIKEER